jgi:hypothetical protein
MKVPMMPNISILPFEPVRSFYIPMPRRRVDFKELIQVA